MFVLYDLSHVAVRSVGAKIRRVQFPSEVLGHIITQGSRGECMDQTKVKGFSERNLLSSRSALTTYMFGAPRPHQNEDHESNGRICRRSVLCCIRPATWADGHNCPHLIHESTRLLASLRPKFAGRRPLGKHFSWPLSHARGD